MTNRIRKITFIFVLGVALAGCMIWAAWDYAGVWIAPKMVLQSALRETVCELENRFDGHPLMVLAELLDEKGRYCADLELTFPDPLWGISQYRGDLQIDFSDHRIKTQGIVINEEDSHRFSVYLDREIAALQTDQMDNEKFYAVEYDSFSSDLKSIPLLSYFLENSLLSKWESGLGKVEELMGKTVPTPGRIQISPEMIEGVLKGILLLPCRVERSDCWLDSRYSSCKITYSLDERTKMLLERGGVRLNPELEEATVSFILYRNSLVQINAEAVVGSEVKECCFFLMEDATVGKAGLKYSVSRQGEANEISVSLSSNRGKESLTESWDISWNADGRSNSIDLDYTWQSDSGKLFLKNAEGKGAFFVMKTTDNGLLFSSDDFMSLPAIFDSEKNKSSLLRMSGTVILRKGSPVAVPDYKPLKECSLEEFAGLLMVLAPVFGWKT